MDQTRFGQSLQGFTRFTGRRDAVRSLGVMGTALLAVLGLADATSARQRQAQNGTVRAERKKKKKCAKGCSIRPGRPVVREGTSDAGPGFITSIALCNPGEYAVGGGYFLFGADLVAVVQMADAPVDDDDGVPIGWSVAVENEDANKSIVARVLCVAD
jgi:hypothetical protein